MAVENIHTEAAITVVVILQRHTVVSNEVCVAEQKEKKDAEGLCVTPTWDEAATKRFYVSIFSAGSHFSLQHKNI